MSCFYIMKWNCLQVFLRRESTRRTWINIRSILLVATTPTRNSRVRLRQHDSFSRQKPLLTFLVSLSHVCEAQAFVILIESSFVFECWCVFSKHVRVFLTAKLRSSCAVALNSGEVFF